MSGAGLCIANGRVDGVWRDWDGIRFFFGLLLFRFFLCQVSPMSSDDGKIVLHRSEDSADSAGRVDMQCFASGKLDVGAMTIKFRAMLKRIAAQELPETLQFRLDDSDLVQETLVRAIRGAGDFKGTTDIELQHWLREILKNQLIDNIRFHSRQQRDVARDVREPMPELVDTGQTPSEAIKQRDSDQRLWLTVAELPEDYRTVVLLRQQMDLSFQEIGERMGKSADAVRMMWGRALVMLGQRLRAAEKRL
jgi:RNA polymerase sigma-70 factor (ECF subfamily)